jgi:hypothetical protein
MGIFSCERCGQAFSKKYNYDQHMKRKVICKIIPKPLTAPTSEIFLEAPESHHLPPTAYMSSPYRPTASFVVPTAPAPAPVPVMPPKRTVAIPLSDEIQLIPFLILIWEWNQLLSQEEDDVPT